MTGTGLTRESGGVSLPVASKLVGDMEVDAPKGVFVDVCPPSPLGERLAHHTYIFHCSSSDGFVQGCLVSISIPLCKDLDDGNGVITMLAEGVDVVHQAERFPMGPMRIFCFSAFSSDTKSVLFLDKANISAEIISFQRGHMCQGIVCGKDELKWARSWESVR
jgi:hypothetical protein